MKVYLVINGDIDDYNYHIKHVFQTREDAELYIEKTRELENIFLTIEEFDIVSYWAKEPKVVYEHSVKYMEYQYDRPIDITLNVKNRLDTDVSGEVVFYGTHGFAIELKISLNEEKTLNKEKAMVLFKKMQNETPPDEMGYRKEQTQKNFARFEEDIRQIFD